MANKRITWIDDARTLTMLLVIIGHCTYYKLLTPYGGINYFDGVAPTEYSLTWKVLGMAVSFIYTFHMPLFMMLSGACFSLSIKNTKGIGTLVKGKAKRLLVPFLCTTLLIVIPIKYLSGYYAESVDLLKDMVLGQLLVMGNTHLWFVFSLFWVFLMFYALYRLGAMTKWWLLPLLVIVSITANYAYSEGIEFTGIILGLKHLVYFAIGFKFLTWFDTLKWGGKADTQHRVLYQHVPFMEQNRYA